MKLLRDTKGATDSGITILLAMFTMFAVGAGSAVILLVQVVNAVLINEFLESGDNNLIAAIPVMLSTTADIAKEMIELAAALLVSIEDLAGLL